jgi:cytochrome c oxidase cbb3-type subunit 4
MGYDELRHFADSWGLLALTTIFVGAVLWAFRPGARDRYRGQAEIPFKHDRQAE